MIRLSVLLLTLLVAGCNEEPLISIAAEASRPEGTLFIARNEQAGITCGAGFLNTLHSRTAANQGDLEVWCRNGDVLNGLAFKNIGQPKSGWAKSNIANVRGHLFDYRGSAVYGGNGWTKATRVLGIPGAIRWYQETPTGYFAVVDGYEDCQGLSIISERGYHGSVSGFWSAMYFHNRHLIANLDYKLKEFAIPGPRESCAVLEGRILSDDDNWIYGVAPYNERLVMGGTHRGGVNADLYLYDGEHTHKVAPETRQQIATEYYSYQRWYDALLIGTYPSGDLVQMAPDGALSMIPVPRTVKGDRLTQREAQSMTILKGTLLVGMYPWGVLYDFDGETWRTMPIIPEVLNTGARMPFETAFRDRYGMSPDADPRNPDEKARLAGVVWDSWGLRITSLAVFDGKLCLGTGNMQGVVYDPKVHTHVPAEIGQQYGDVFCSAVPAHGLVQFDGQTPGELTVQIYRDRLVVLKNGREIKEVEFSNDMAEHLASGSFEVTKGYGPYGALATR